MLSANRKISTTAEGTRCGVLSFFAPLRIPVGILVYCSYNRSGWW